MEIKEALARGYCSERNNKKVLDPDLLEDMAIEIEKLIQDAENIKPYFRVFNDCLKILAIYPFGSEEANFAATKIKEGMAAIQEKQFEHLYYQAREEINHHLKKMGERVDVEKAELLSLVTDLLNKHFPEDKGVNGILFLAEFTEKMIGILLWG